MNNFELMTKPKDAGAVLDAYAAAAKTASGPREVPPDVVEAVAPVDAATEPGEAGAEPAEAGAEPAEAVAEPAEAVAEPAEPDDATGAMARLLELAATNADQLLAEARAEAEELTAAAHAEADKLLADARSAAEKLRAESQAERSKAEDEIAELHQTGTDHRERMRDHFHELLAKVEAAAIV